MNSVVAFFRWVWGRVVALGRWLKENPLALASMLGAVVGAFFMWKSNKNKIASLEEAVEVQAHKRKIAVKTTEAKMLEERADSREPEVKELKKEIAKSKRRVVELSEAKDLGEKSDEEVADLFTNSGL